MPIRITGLNSGLDTEALVSELVSAYRKKTEKYTKAQTKLQWKQEAWKSLNSKISSFHSKLTSLRYTSAYNIRSTTVSDPTKATVKASSSAINGTYSLKIKSLARSGYLTGAELGNKITESSKLSELGYTGGNGTITVNADGKTTDIAVTNDTTISEFVRSLNNAGVKANYDASNHRIFVASAQTGADSDFSLTGTNANGATALFKMGLSVASSADQQIYKDWASYALNTDGDAYVTYDANGNAQFNGTYDAAATSANVATLLTSVQNASATITNTNAQAEYGKAYQTKQAAEKNLTADEIRDLQKLAKEKDASKVQIDADGNIYDELTSGEFKKRGTEERYTAQALADKGVVLSAGEDRLLEVQEKAGLTKEEEQENGTLKTVADADKMSAYQKSVGVVSAYEATDAEGNQENAAQIAEVVAAYQSGDFDTYLKGLQDVVDQAQETLANNAILNDATLDAAGVADKITNAVGVLNGSVAVQYSPGATRVNGQDALFEINGAEYTSTKNEITVNGMTVTALSETGNEELSITIGNNTQGLYDKIKDIIKEYNTLINEMTSLYNADSSKGYEPLTNEEKDAMSDTDVENWEKKIKGSLLRRDDTLDSLLNSMSSTMLKSYSINGKNYSLSSFGIHTLGVLYSNDNEENAFHIDGNEEDALTSGNADKLMQALNTDPDAVVEFMKQLTSGLYDSINKKMGASTLSSFNVVYNDKEMAREYSDYTETIKKWEDKLADIEDSYYKKFAAMETALAKLQSQQNQFANMLGM